jgi:hypothetical protein
MSLEEAILDKVRRLPPAMQQEVLRFADGLQQNTATGCSRRVIARGKRSGSTRIEPRTPAKLPEHRLPFVPGW